MRLDLIVNSALLAAGLGFAYWASVPTDASDEQKIDVLDIAESSIKTVKFAGPEVTVIGERRADDGRFWITHSRVEQVKQPKPQDAKPDDPEPAPTPVTKTERLLANEKFEEFVKSFDPLRAERIIGEVSEDRYAEFGLEGLKFKFTITQDGGKETQFYLGKKSYGSQNRFVMETDSSGKAGRVILIADQGFDNFEKANLRMHDRRIVSIPMEEVTKAQIKAGGVDKTIAHTSKDKNGEPVWSEDEDGAVQKPAFESWMDKLSKLRLASYADEAQEKELASIQPFLEVELQKNGSVVDRILFKKLSGDKPAYFVYSDFLKVHANIVSSRAEPLEKDIGAVFGGTKS